MYSAVTVTILLGAVLGGTLRLPTFLVAALAVTLVALVMAGWQVATACFAAVQVGYVVGLVARAALSILFKARTHGSLA